jgi:lysophospholipase L1-like esterase
MNKTFSFLALGNSLTVGYIPYRISNQPYTRFLKKLIDDFLLESEKNEVVDVRILNKGVNGDLTRDLLFRFQRDVIDSNPDYVIILGGTNDIGWGCSSQEIINNLKIMFKMARENGIRPIGCTIPSVLGWDDGIQPRLEINDLLVDYCRSKNVLSVDLFSKTCDPESERLRSDYSSDGLHLNILGYKKVAESIFEELIRDLQIHNQI